MFVVGVVEFVVLLFVDWDCLLGFIFIFMFVICVFLNLEFLILVLLEVIGWEYDGLGLV